jgi:hypothetical protein
MKDWKIRQFIYHSTTEEYVDDLSKFKIIYNEDAIVDDAVIHFSERVEEFLYPAKSYFVAICYAYWIEQEYGDSFYESLNDPDLLYGNDPYFKTYNEAKETYDQIISRVELLPMTGMVQDVRKYYEAECGIK